MKDVPFSEKSFWIFFFFTFICALCCSLARVCIDFIRHIFVKYLLIFVSVFFLNEYCGERLNVEFYDQFRLRLARDPRHQPSLHCKLLLHTNRQNYMLVTFTDLDIKGDCDSDWLELHDGSSRTDPYLAGKI